MIDVDCRAVGPAAGRAASGVGRSLLLAAVTMLGVLSVTASHAVGDRFGDLHVVGKIDALERAAALGDVEAAYRLGVFLVSHPRNPKDGLVAERHLRFAAERGHVDAQHVLGLTIIRARGTEDRVQEGLSWLGSAAASGDALAAVVLGRLHETGMHGVRQDSCLAHDWYEVGAMLGLHPPADYLESLKDGRREPC